MTKTSQPKLLVKRVVNFCIGVNPHSPVVLARQRKAYIRDSMFVWGIPFVVIGICVALQFANIGNVGYGENILFQLLHWIKKAICHRVFVDFWALLF